ncbi:MAG: serine/threonine protein kinase [Planctomycetaceae bacterium]|jgi:serine/threonine protein kinase|nr:serine/threonine protein kinase [Planctomycetaceae bacterium]MBT4723757.1 serine/threonine protein kinase [Planctomycetaceae bacterium]MBT4846652.1 serine/threonine protein kinase [Planctomycetaceae bacterium]MBT5126066.1 serine/threonine protein kinase [Planctomycetaceae bacterium]MBT5598028.1 serine/threonine protein kinase [Planctomycetaceae bacterium]
MLKQLGPYIIDKQIGRGGMGFVYAAHHEDTAEVVAVKMLSLGFADDENFRSRFSLEIETLKQLHHEGIVEIFGFGEQDGTLFYSMELVDGPSLFETLKSDGPVAWRDVVRMTIEICHALKHAHDRGVIHRDLKPSNLIVSQSGSVKLVDFGIARLFGSAQLTADHAVVGTADYMSPEQAEGQRPTVRSDLYSLGAVMYALLSGKPPFSSPSIAQVIHRLRHDPPPSLLNANLDVPRELNHIIDQLLSKNPDDRVPTPLAVIHRLQAMQHALDSQLPTPTNHPLVDITHTTAAATYTDDAPTGEFTRSEVDEDNSPTLLHPTMPGPYQTGATSDELSLADIDSEQAPLTTVDEGIHSHFTRVDPTRAEEQTSQKSGMIASILIAIGFLAVVGGIFAFTNYMNRAATAKELLKHILQARIDPGSDWAQAHVEMEDFIARFPDHDQYEEIKQLHDELAAERDLQKYIDQLSKDRESLSVVELQLLLTLDTAAEDPQATVAQLESFIATYDVFTSDKNSVRCVDFAQIQLKLFQLKAIQADQDTTRLKANYNDEINRIIAAATELANSDHAQALNMLHNAKVLFSQHKFLNDELHSIDDAIKKLGDVQ